MEPQLLEQAADRLGAWERVMLLSHARPDGDSLGGLAAMKRQLEATGRSPTAFLFDEIPPRYRFLDAPGLFTPWAGGDPAALDARFDGILILDTCSWQQLEPAADYLKASRLPRIVVDHHATRDELTGRGAGDDLYVIDASAASASVMLLAWAETAGWDIDGPTGEALFTGIATDTGWFRFSNTDNATLQAAAKLIERGVRPDVLYAKLYASHSPGRVRLMGEVLSSLSWHADGAVAVMALTPAMFDETGAARSDTEDLVNEPLAAEPVVVSVLLTDLGDGQIRVSFRSKSPEVAARDVDVAALACAFGGGGHRRAAGARINGTLDEVRQRVTAAAVAAMTEQGSAESGKSHEADRNRG